MDIILTIARIFIIGSSIAGLLGWIWFYRKTREPAALAPVSWLIGLVLFNIWRFVIRDGTALHQAITNYFSAALHIWAVILLIAAIFIFKDKKLWTWRH